MLSFIFKYITLLITLHKSVENSLNCLSMVEFLSLQRTPP